MEKENTSVGDGTPQQQDVPDVGGKRERDDNFAADSAANKKQIVEAPATSSVGSSNVIVETIDEAEEQKTESESDVCALCMEGAVENKVIIPHNCPRCRKDAWVICDLCNESRLSRSCPMCNGDYAPLLLYSMPGDAEFLDMIKDKPLPQQAHCMKALQFAKIRLISVSNVMVYNPVDRLLSFSLPVDATLPPKQVRYMLVTLPLRGDLAESGAATAGAESGESAPAADDAALVASMVTALENNGVFRFSNRVWDLLEARVETEGDGDANAGPFNGFGRSSSGDIRSAMAFVMGALSRRTFSAPGASSGSSVLYSCMTPAELECIAEPEGQGVGGADASV